jgi:hypothetical protein
MMNGTRDGIRFQRNAAIGDRGFGCDRIGDRVGQLGFDDAGIDAGDAQLAVFLPQPIRDGADRPCLKMLANVA